MEFKKQNDTKPKQIIRLEKSKVQLGKDILGEDNTLIISSDNKHTIFLKATTNDSYIEWLSAFSSNCSNELNFDTNLADAFNEAVVISTGKGIIVEVNEAAAQLFKYNKNKMIGQHINILIPESIAKVIPLKNLMIIY